MDLDLFWRNYLVEIPTAMELSTWIAMGPCLHPVSDRVVQIGTAVWTLMKIVPYSSSADDAMMLHIILHTTSKMSLAVGTKSSGLSGPGGPLLRKWAPLAQLLA